MNTGDDWAECVFGVADTEEVVTPSNICKAAVEGFITDCLSLWLDLMSVDAQVVGISAHGVVPGAIPYRVNFVLGSQMGTREGSVMPANVSGIVHFYGDPADGSPGQRVRTSKSSVPGLSEDDVTSKYLSSDWVTAAEALAGQFITGFVGGGVAGSSFKRLLSAVTREFDEDIRTCTTWLVKQVVGSVRRRLYPQ
jgi:hypothetical protein